MGKSSKSFSETYPTWQNIVGKKGEGKGLCLKCRCVELQGEGLVQHFVFQWEKKGGKEELTNQRQNQDVSNSDL